MNNLMASALRYADEGFQVFPLHHVERGVCSCRRNCGNPAKHPRTQRGVYDASSDPDQIEKWWGEWPDANIGIRTGEASNLWVVDIDNKRSVDIGGGVLISQGEHSIRSLEEQAGSTLTDTRVSLTGGGGRHYVYQYPRSAGEYTNRVNVAPSVDIRGERGYIVAPPSIHASGKRYEWLDETEPIAHAPQWFLSLQKRSEGETFQEQESVEEGSRNDYLFKYAARLRGVEGRSGQELATLVMAHNLMHCTPALSVGEVTRIVQNAERYEPNSDEYILDFSDQAEEHPDLDDGADVAISISELFDNPPQPLEPLIHGGILDKGDGFVLGGVSGIGKSWLAMDMAIAVASGTPWVGEFPTEQGPVIYIDEEGSPSGMHERMQMLFRGRDLDHTGLPLYVKVLSGIRFDTQKGITTLSRLCERYEPKLVIFDALVRFHGGDENSTQDMARFFDVSKRLQAAYEVAFLFIHHIRKPGKDDSGDPVDQLRGSSDIRGWPDGIMLVSDPTGDAYKIVHGKSRNHKKLNPFEVGHVIEEGDAARFGYRGEAEHRNRNTQDTRGATLKLIAKEGPIEADGIAGHMGLTTKVVKEHLRAMVAERSLAEVKMGSNVYYQVAHYQQKELT